MTLLQLTQLIIASLAFIVSVVWFLVERRRVRYISVLWGLWSAGLIAFRVAVYFLPVDHTQDQILLLNSLSNTLFLFGAASVLCITTYHIIGAYKHGRHHIS